MILLVLAAAVSASAQGTEGTVSGVVVDAQTQQRIWGARVEVVGTESGAVTDSRGQFVLRGLSGDEITLEATMLGYHRLSQTVAIGDRDVRLALRQAAIELEAVIVTGTPGETQRRAIGNAVGTLNVAREMEARPVGDMHNLLQGRVAGVTVRRPSGNLGTGGGIHIRGLSSLSLSNEPLIYVDGVRVNNDPNSGPAIRGGSQASRLNDINPQDIQSMEVIKGPAAATLYGTEASGGVIQIITKRGMTGSPTLDVSIKQGLNFLRDPAGRLPTVWGRDPATGELISINHVEAERAVGRELFQYGHTQSFNASLRGGTDEVRYFASATWDDSEGVVSYNWQKKLSGRANLQLFPTERLDVDVGISYVTEQIRFAQAHSGFDLMTQLVWGDPASRDTRLRGYLRATPEAAATIEALSEVDRTTVNLMLNYRPWRWLTNRIRLGTDVTHEDNSQLIPRHPEGTAYFFGAGSLGQKTAERKFARFTTVDYSGTASFDLTQDLSLASSVGAQYIAKVFQSLESEGQRFPAPPVTLVSGAAVTFGGESFLENKTLGVFIQETLAWRDRLFVTAAVRGDDNSAFGQNFTFVTYPKFSGTWMLHEEPFFRLPLFSTLRLRAAWGQAGQQPDVFAAIRLYQPTTGPTDASTLSPLTLGNPDLAPEKGEELELGFDAGLLDDRFAFEFTYYDQRRKNAILPRQVPPSSGFPGIQFVNVGEIRSWGVELGIQANILRTPDLTWDLGFSVHNNDSEVVDLGGLPAISTGPLSMHREGFPVGSHFMRRVVSAELDAGGNLISALCEGGSRIAETNLSRGGGEPEPCATAPRVFSGTPNPKWTGSLENNVTVLRNLRLSALVDFQTGHRMISGDIAAGHLIFRNTEAIHNPHLFPLLTAYDQIGGGVLYEAGLYNAGWANLRNLSATYTLPATLASRFGLSRGSVTISGQNLAYLWRAQKDVFGFNIMDPEQRPTGADHSGTFQTVLPHMTTFVTTFNLTF